MKKKSILISIILLFSSLHSYYGQTSEIGLKVDYGYLVNSYGSNLMGATRNYELDGWAASYGVFYEKKLIWKFSASIGADIIQKKSNTLKVGTAPPLPYEEIQYKYTYNAVKVPINIIFNTNRFMYGAIGVNYHHDFSEFETHTTPFENGRFTGIGYQGELGIQMKMLSLVRVRLGGFVEINNVHTINNHTYLGKIWYGGLRARAALRF